MGQPKVIRRPDGTVLVERFAPIRRAEHWLVLITFVVLVVTGFPQKFHTTGWARWVFQALGGLDMVRSIHRIAGIVFAVHVSLHVLGFIVGILTHKMRWTMLPVPQDLRDAWQNLQYYLGFRKAPPQFPKFDYRQKFEYLGIVLGGMVMITSGLILLYPIETASLLPGEVIPAALVAHSNEAMLALLVLVVWHVYGSTLSPEVFPGDRSIFNGYIPLHELRERHGREYRRLRPMLADMGIDEPAEHAEHAGDEAAEPAAEPAADEAAEEPGSTDDSGEPRA
jgi:formate dehydrogenase subunit gamma